MNYRRIGMTERIHTTLRAMLIFAAFASPYAASIASDWPTYAHDSARSGLTAEALPLPLLESWRFESFGAPEPAWPEPAQNDYSHRLIGLNPAVTFDRAYQIVAKDGNVYFASSADDKVYCLDAETGNVRWSFFTEAPVRFAPTVAGGRLYVGSDDGYVYCLNSKDGALLWKYAAAPKDYRLPGNGRMMSLWPIRTSVLVEGETAFFFAGLFPTHGTFLCALDSETGDLRWKQQTDISPQGYMLASRNSLFVPTGRTAPAVFSKTDGKSLGSIDSPGGSFAILAGDTLVSGPGRGTGSIAAGDVSTKDSIATFTGLRMVINGDFAYIQSTDSISALNRTRYLDLARQDKALSARRKQLEDDLKKNNPENDSDQRRLLTEQIDKIKTQMSAISARMKTCLLWTRPLSCPYSLVMAGDTLFAGGDNTIAAISSRDGEILWTAPVDGKTWALAVADGSLLASTGKGTIHCFRPEAHPGKTEVSRPTPLFPDDTTGSLFQSSAKHILKESSVTKGWCVVLGSEHAQLAIQLAAMSDLRIVCVEQSGEKVAASRKAIDSAGLCGRIAVHHITSDELPYADYFANIIVSEDALLTGRLPSNRSELLRILRPEGGTILIGQPDSNDEPTAITEANCKEWLAESEGFKTTVVKKFGLWVKITRQPLAGAGQWTHLYADQANTACSNDTLVHGNTIPQWFGSPGPRDMIDRHHRNMAPLCKNGRLFIPGDQVIWAVDAYNGTTLWEVSIPSSRRLGIFLDSGNMAVDDRYLYVAAADKCLAFDVRSGQNSLTFQMPRLPNPSPGRWGYLAYADKLLFGSGTKPQASYQETGREADESLWYPDMRVVTSGYVFAIDRRTGDLKWTYNNGVILNTTIAIGNGQMYFIETTSPKASSDVHGRMPVKDLFDGGAQYLVSVEAVSGKVIYRNEIDAGKITQPAYLNFADGLVLLSGSGIVDKHIHYYYYAFDSGTGELKWQADHNSELPLDGGHGEYNRHPTIIGDTVYGWPYAYELHTGRQIEGWKFNRLGHGCGGISASSNAMFWRGLNPWIYNLGEGGGPSRINKVTRPGCWINIIPAGGLILIPEASSGCTCGYPIQTSLAYRPVD
jgi:outer membrane protein assembly factor BamB